jgi:hypothetical protein
LLAYPSNNRSGQQLFLLKTVFRKIINLTADNRVILTYIYRLFFGSIFAAEKRVDIEYPVHGSIKGICSALSP